MRLFGIASIPSTGTRFSCDLFGLDYLHIDSGISWHDFVRTRKIICPMRHPLEVIKTWRVLRTPSANDVFDCYDSLLKFRSDIDFWLPVDSPGSRDNCLQRINEAMSCKFETTWQRVGNSGQVGHLEKGDEARAVPYIELYDKIVSENLE